MEYDPVNASSLHELEGATIELLTDPHEGSQLAERTLVGKIFTEKPLSKHTVKDIISKAWGLKTEVTISDMGVNIFLFNFSDKQDTMKVHEGGPWSVMGHIVSLQSWSPEVSVFEIDFSLIDCWVQIHGIPLDSFSTTNTAKIASYIGEVLEVENPLVDGHLLRTFLRVKVRLNTMKPLLTGFWIPRKDLPKTWVFIKYEKMMKV